MIDVCKSLPPFKLELVSSYYHLMKLFPSSHQYVVYFQWRCFIIAYSWISLHCAFWIGLWGSSLTFHNKIFLFILHVNFLVSLSFLLVKGCAIIVFVLFNFTPKRKLLVICNLALILSNFPLSVCKMLRLNILKLWCYNWSLLCAIFVFYVDFYAKL